MWLSQDARNALSPLTRPNGPALLAELQLHSQQLTTLAASTFALEAKSLTLTLAFAWLAQTTVILIQPAVSTQEAKLPV